MQTASSTYFIDEIGCWKKEKVLGSGGFGYVVLWRNKETNETIALKQCRLGNDPLMTPKHRSRWKQEVDIMLQLKHPNVVRAVAVPRELDVPPTELPLLGMEFCSSGDLRKLLSKPENCCGLKEKHIRLIMKHTTSAVNYLHSKGIIHRDLKPENIVIQNQNGKAIYKLIDLGYAKVLDQGSLCSSFVGTLQYLAPELFMCQKYTCTVDYWSLGLLTHEIITGVRPFLPDKSPAEWILIVKTKSSDQIRAYLDEDKNIVFSTEIAPCHYISKVFKQDIEKWLQLMLNCDPEQRGRNENIMFSSLLEKILTKKIALVFCIESLELLSFPISDQLTYEEFRKLLEEETKIPVIQQQIILPNGQAPDPKKGLDQFISNMEEEEFIVFLYDTKNSSSSPVHSSTFLSKTVKRMMNNPRAKVGHLQQKSTWAEAIHLCQKEYIRVVRVLQSFKVSVKKLMSDVSVLHKSISHITEEINILVAKCEFLKCSLQKDIACYEKQKDKLNGYFPKLLEEWKTNLKNLEKIEILRQRHSNETMHSNITAQALELQKSPYFKSKTTSQIEEVFKKVLESYSELKKRSAEKQKIAHDNIDFVRLLSACLHYCQTIIQEVLSLISKIKELNENLSSSQPEILSFEIEIVHWGAQVKNWQSQRQQQIWNLVSSLANAAKPTSPLCDATNKSEACIGPSERTDSNRAIQESLVHSQPSSAINKSWGTELILENSHSLAKNHNKSSSDSLSSTGKPSFSSILNYASRENQRVKEENQCRLADLQSMMSTLMSYKTSD